MLNRRKTTNVPLPLKGPNKRNREILDALAGKVKTSSADGAILDEKAKVAIVGQRGEPNCSVLLVSGESVYEIGAMSRAELKAQGLELTTFEPTEAERQQEQRKRREPTREETRDMYAKWGSQIVEPLGTPAPETQPNYPRVPIA